MAKDLTSNPADSSKHCPVIAIGASAGGLIPIKDFIRSLPPETAYAIVIIQHLDPNSRSQMKEILEAITILPITVIKNKDTIIAGHIYLNPPGKIVFVENNKLMLKQFDIHTSSRLPIDFFMKSLANNYILRSIAIILSGTGSDGAFGIKEIKASGGIICVQDIEEAEFDEMPRNAINSCQVDFILKASEFVSKLEDFQSHPYIEKIEQPPLGSLNDKIDLDTIASSLLKVTGHDFSGYKTSTFLRRIERRMAIHQITIPENYVKLIASNNGEAYELYLDLLISVTSFFRDPEAFESLKKELTKLMQMRSPEKGTFRVWITACSTGEEAYSIAIILDEILQELKISTEVQIFATDLNANSIEIARKGVYAANIETDLDADRLAQYFIKDALTYRINKEIRNRIVYAQHDLTRDAPFINIDLITCRNFLIYQSSDLQRKVINLFAYTLSNDGILMLGSSESIDENTFSFKSLDSKWKIFRKSEHKKEMKIFPSGWLSSQTDQLKYHSTKQVIKPMNLVEKLNRIILEDFSFPSVLINSRLQILYFRGNTEKFLKPPEGEAEFNILKMLNEDVRYKVSSAINKAVKENNTVIVKALIKDRKIENIQFDLIIRPLALLNDDETYFIVVFKEKASVKASKITTEKGSDEGSAQWNALLEENEMLRTQLKAVTEEIQESNEIMQSINEELQAKNEELQSSNEELETSKEELKSTNEEMRTVNTELKEKLSELSAVNSDINNLFSSTEIATLFLDIDLNIRRFTPKITQLFNLLPFDIGRPISDIKSKLINDNITEDAEIVISTLKKISRELQDQDGNWYKVSFLPYRTTDNIIDGAAVTFINITRIKYLSRLEAILYDSNDAIILTDTDGNIKVWNKGASDFYGYTENEALSMNISVLIPKNKQKEHQEIVEKLKNGVKKDTYFTKRILKNGKSIEVQVTLGLLHDKNANNSEIVVTERDLSKYIAKEKKLHQEIDKLKSELTKYNPG